MSFEQMLQHHKQARSDGQQSVELLGVIGECYVTCLLCADACLAEEQIDMLRRCIRLNLDCSAVCGALATLITGQQGSQELLQQQLQACITACEVCGEECRKHAQQHEHCRICAEVCERCAEACRQVAAAPAM